MSVLLGLIDVEISNLEPETFTTNRIGGSPAWMSNSVTTICPICNKPLLLVVQIYCPLEDSDYHRTIYIFACMSPSCHKNAHGWKAIRCQCLDNPSKQASLVVDADASLCSEAMSDWIDDADDWGVPGNTAESLAEHVSNALYCNLNDLSVASHNFDSSYSHQVEKCASTNEQNDIAEECPQSKENVIPESEPESSVLFAGLFSLPLSSGCSYLQAYHVTVIEEPTEVTEVSKNEGSHIRQLLTVYEKEEGRDLSVLLDRFSKTDHPAELYESGQARHEDKRTHTFFKRIRLCPEQCIRYSWKGDPLFICDPNKEDSERLAAVCDSCGSKCQVEIQLMPALVNFLRYPDAAGVPIEFGTVMILTCTSSCWTESDCYKEERVIVQPDPDDKLLAKITA